MGSWTTWSSWSAWRSPALVGLDLSDDGLRLVELQGRRDQLLLCAVATHPLPPGCVVDGDIQQFDAVVNALQQCLREHPVRTGDVAMALPTDAVRLDCWGAPLGMDDGGLADFVAEQVMQRWSAEPQDLSFDYGYVVAEPGAAEQGNVWVAAARLDLVQDRQGLAQACGLRLTDLESVAQANSRVWQVPGLSAEGAEPALAQPFEGMRLGPRLLLKGAKGWPTDGALYATACGLALRRFMP